MKREFSRDLFPDAEFNDASDGFVGSGYYKDVFERTDESFDPADYSIDSEAGDVAERLMSRIEEEIEEAELYEASSGILERPVYEILIHVLQEKVAAIAAREAQEKKTARQMRAFRKKRKETGESK